MISFHIFLLLLLFTLFGSIGSFFFKKVSGTTLSFNRKFVTYLFLGGLFYGIGAILNIIALQHAPYTIIFPLTSLTYIWTLVISYVFLNEVITKRKFFGIFLIIIGSFLLTR